MPQQLSVKSFAASSSILTGIVLIAVLGVRGLELIFGNHVDSTLDAVTTLVLGAFITAVTAERVARSVQSGEHPILDGLKGDKNASTQAQSGGESTGPGDTTV